MSCPLTMYSPRTDHIVGNSEWFAKIYRLPNLMSAHQQQLTGDAQLLATLRST